MDEAQAKELIEVVNKLNETLGEVLEEIKEIKIAVGKVIGEDLSKED
jgi:regulator of replication initiation timing